MGDLAIGRHVAIRRRWARRAASLRSELVALGAASIMLALVPAVALAAAEQLRLVVAGPDQGEASRLAEVLSDPLAEVLGRPVAVERLAGAGGIAAAQAGPRRHRTAARCCSPITCCSR